MEKFIYESTDVLTVNECNTIISFFENDKNNNLKATEEVFAISISKLSKFENSSGFQDIHDKIINILETSIKKYYEEISFLNDNESFCPLDGKLFILGYLIIKKTNIPQGYNNDEKYRIIENYNMDGCKTVLEVIIFLNDNYENGDFVFLDKYSVKPNQGKILIYPSTFTFPYKQLLEKNGFKYIIQCHIYVK